MGNFLFFFFLLKEDGRNAGRGKSSYCSRMLGKGMWGRGPCKHTPSITVKNKAGAGLLLGQRLPGSGQAGQLTTSSSHTATPKGRAPALAGPRGAQQCTSDSPRRAHSCAHTHRHTPKHFEPVNTTVIQRQWGGKGGSTRAKYRKD